MENDNDNLQVERGHRNDHGFTLLEMIITVMVIVILASVAVPNYIQSKLMANEGAIVATMRTLSTAQLKFKTAGLLDMDADGSHEHGAIREMAGIIAVRGTGEMLTPADLPISIGELDAAGRARRHGYFIAMYLPDASGVGLPDTDSDLPNVAPDHSEHYWSCLAWPIQLGSSGTHTYFVNQQGEVLKNRSARYSGTTRVPPAGAALLGNASADHINSTEVAIDRVGADGFRWIVVH